MDDTVEATTATMRLVRRDWGWKAGHYQVGDLSCLISSFTSRTSTPVARTGIFGLHHAEFIQFPISVFIDLHLASNPLSIQSGFEA